jgi:predicted transcriptional regulator
MIDWIMYAEIHNLKRQGFKKAKVAKKLGINREMVKKYWDMSPDDYGTLQGKHRAQKPDVYLV